METCLRGFSFMLEKPADVKLQYIEDNELERTWKTTRRQRLKEREQKIYDDFVKEEDVLTNMCKDDPYQFIEKLPEVCLKELMEIEFQKMKKDTAQESPVTELEQQGGGDSPRQTEEMPSVTFADDDDADSDIIHIFDDNDDEQSGPEDEAANDDSLGSPCTVRENVDDAKECTSPLLTPDKKTSKSSENVATTIESSIYCAKVKDLRLKMNEELLGVISSLQGSDVGSADPDELVKMCRRSTEFCGRFNRIYLYQLQRQIQDVKRNNTVSLPFARHTQFQSQMVRIVSLHSNCLQAIQIFHKSFEQTGCVRESADMLGALVSVVRDASAECAAAPTPQNLVSARDLYDDAVLQTCEKLEEAINQFSIKTSSYLKSASNTSTAPSKKSTCSRERGSSYKPKMKSGAESRLSMYSMDPSRRKPFSSRSHQSASGANKVAGDVQKNTDSAKQTTVKKTGCRRPLMRDPHEGRVRRSRPARDSDIHTMVEAVDACTSSHIDMNRGSSSHQMLNLPVDQPARRSCNNTPRNLARSKDVTPRKSTKKSPKSKGQSISPNKTNYTVSPKPAQILKALTNIKSKDPLATAESSQNQMQPIDLVSKSETSPYKPVSPRTAPELPKQSPRYVNDVKSVGDDKVTSGNPGGRCEVGKIVRQLCGGDAVGNRNERVCGAKNAQLVCMKGSSPSQPSTPQLLRILEETIQKKVPKTFHKISPDKNAERFRLTFNIPEKTVENLFNYRTKFVQHMLASSMYANSAVSKPWEMIGRLSEHIIDDLLMQCADELQLHDIVQELYQEETR